MAALEESLYGTWKITECVSLSGDVEITGIEGTEFVLDENGDVSWEVPDEAERLPFFNCETYEVCPAVGSDATILKFASSCSFDDSGTYAGDIVEFRVEVSGNLLLLTYDVKCCILQCQKITKNMKKDDSPYSLLSALDQGFFSDVIIRADSGKEFKVHSLLLHLSAPELDWEAVVPPLTGLPEDVLSLSLYFLYAECLPRDLTEARAQKCVKMVGKMPGFSRLGKMCETFLENMALTQQMKTLVNDMQKCTDRIDNLFYGCSMVNAEDDDDDERTVNLEGTMWTDPAKLCYTVRQAMREEALVIAKFVILCDLFSKSKHELSREERHEIMKTIKSRIPFFLKQLVTLLKAIRTHLRSLTQSQRNNLASYLVPEIDTILDVMFRFANEVKAVLEQTIILSEKGKGGEKTDNNNKGKKKKSWAVDALGSTMRHALHVKELKTLKKFHKATTAQFNLLRQKRDNFDLKSETGKERTVSQTLLRLSDQFTLRNLEYYVENVEHKMTWKEWKYYFKLTTSKVSWFLRKLQANKERLQPTVEEICGIVRSEEFDASLVALCLKVPSPTTPPTTNATSLNSSSNDNDSDTAKYTQLSNVASLCVSPNSTKSVTAKRALDLFKEGTHTDMVFEVISLPEEGGDLVIDHTEGMPEGCAGAEGGVDMTKEEGEMEVVEFKAHRVMVAARCDWFRRALLSGMKESINRKIVVHDVPAELFQRFLESLYSGMLDTSKLSVEQLADMMTLCDRYQMDGMKRQCENDLRCEIDEENAICLLNLADHLNSKDLRDSALRFIAEHQELVDLVMYDELPEHLKEAIQDAIDWRGLDSHGGGSQSDRGLAGMRLTHSSSNTSLSEVDELAANLSLHDQYSNNSTSNPHRSDSSSSSDDLALVEDVSRLEECVQDLVDIIGDSVPREELNRIAIAADYDVNRALNFFFSS